MDRSVGLVCFLHAYSRPAGPVRQHYLLLWCCSLVGGLANDVVFSWLPVVDNFWHAQASVMLTPRFPLYLFGAYLAFLYLPTAMAWRLKLAPVAEAALMALLAWCVYSPWDVVGARLLWWTWHDSDLLIGNRLAGVPCASTVWQLCFCFCYSGAVRVAVGDAEGQDARPLTPWRAARTFLAAQLLPVPLMLLFINLLLFLGGLIDGEVAMPPPPATSSAVRFTEGLFVAAAAYGVYTRFFANQPKGAPAPKTTGGASFLTLGFVIHRA